MAKALKYGVAIALVLVVCVELGLQLLPPAWTPAPLTLVHRVYGARGTWHRMMEGDADLGYKLRSGIDLDFPSEEGPVRFRTEAYGAETIGFRSVGTLPPFDSIAVGGSFTVCDDVAEQDCWVRRLSESTGSSIATLGVNGYSTLAAAKMLHKHGRQFRPKLVFVGVFPNDFKDNVNFDAWRKTGDDNFWEWLGKRRGRSGVDRWLADRSMSFRLLDGARRGLRRNIVRFEKGDVRLIFRLDPWWLDLMHEPRQNEGWPLLEEGLLAMKKDADEVGAIMVALLFPMKEQVYWQDLKEEAPQLGDPDVGALLRELGEFAAEHGILACNLLADLQEERGRQLYHRISSHWNAAGHEVGAASIERCLTRQGLSPARQ